ncbi:MAG TPA: hypothetical protein VFW93_12515, partial [Aquabacterium sp.]|uniref:hypothetical protein n=1 Tax=Aquabacterium sp. TaxID=1872578 RepID=UPI002E307082
ATPKPHATFQPEEKSAAERLLEKIIANDDHLKAYCERKQRYSDEEGSFNNLGGLPLPQFRKKLRK